MAWIEGKVIKEKLHIRYKIAVSKGNYRYSRWVEVSQPVEVAVLEDLRNEAGHQTQFNMGGKTS